ncbi:RidA family protein [Virgibacillus sediminis]|uniref:RidA family protein n=1 Tax=Virgibacillus sediminis TaxID=202260 RepID=A0ABV7A8Z8_9BACI
MRKVNTTTAIILFGSVLLMLVGTFTYAGSQKEVLESDEVSHFGPPTSSTSNSVSIPKEYDQLWLSGMVPPILDEEGETSYEKYGDTETQAIGIFEDLEAQLEEKGLSLSDVMYLRVYVASDPNNGDEPDFAGFFKAYGEFFDTEENPVKTARSTVGVDSLAEPGWLIKIEAFVAYSS